MGERLGPETFDLPVPEIRAGWFSASYFNKAKVVAAKYHEGKHVVMQVFQKNDAVLCGVDEAIAVLKIGTGHWGSPTNAMSNFETYRDARNSARKHRLEGAESEMMKIAQGIKTRFEGHLEYHWFSGWNELQVHALYDGDRVSPWEPVMHIKGPYHLFAHLESVYLGILARRTAVATNVARVVAETRGKPLLFFADRFDHFATQGGDGYSAHIGGAQGVATDSMGNFWGEPGMGTMPHALIALFDGDTVEAAKAFHETYPETNLTVLVDFNNDCVTDSLKCLAEFGSELWGVRLDTSETMVDASIYAQDMGRVRPTGVNPLLVHKVRQALDKAGGQHVKIVVSGGFDAEKIRKFEEESVPVDAYGVGSSLLRKGGDFTADIVLPVAKTGRWYEENPRMSVVH